MPTTHSQLAFQTFWSTVQLGPLIAARRGGVAVVSPAAREIEPCRPAGEEAQQPEIGPPGHDIEWSSDQVAVAHFWSLVIA